MHLPKLLAGWLVQLYSAVKNRLSAIKQSFLKEVSKVMAFVDAQLKAITQIYLAFDHLTNATFALIAAVASGAHWATRVILTLVLFYVVRVVLEEIKKIFTPTK